MLIADIETGCFALKSVPPPPRWLTVGVRVVAFVVFGSCLAYLHFGSGFPQAGGAQPRVMIQPGKLEHWPAVVAISAATYVLLVIASRPEHKARLRQEKATIAEDCLKAARTWVAVSARADEVVPDYVVALQEAKTAARLARYRYDISRLMLAIMVWIPLLLAMGSSMVQIVPYGDARYLGGLLAFWGLVLMSCFLEFWRARTRHRTTERKLHEIEEDPEAAPRPLE